MKATAAPNDNNHLLCGVPRRRRESILNACERVSLAQNEVLCEPGDRIRHAYFPTEGMIALMSDVDGHEALALALIGNEGMLGSSAMFGIERLPLRARVQEAGSALRIKVPELQRVVTETPSLRRQLLLYFSSVFAQVGRTAACAVAHAVDARIAYWLLMTHDRTDGDRFALTHDVLAHMLGVRRSGVTAAAGVLQARNVIAYTRGQVSILDREGLERAACDCYGTVRGTSGTISTMFVART